MSKKYTCFSSKVMVGIVMIFMSLSTIELNATHIVGSDMSFRCLGNDFYEITLTVRRDCINGADDAPFDNPASLGIFDSNGNRLSFLGNFGQILMPFTAKDSIGAGRPECGFFGGGICVEQSIYVSRAYLPFRAGGYVLTYQRCCRNVTLNNILSPLETGSTKTVRLLESTLRECNSSPTFSSWPELIICANEPLVFNHPATDADGDSLSYKLYTPNSGATIDFPKPQPPPGPPYGMVQFAQGYSLDNLLGGVPLAVDARTGVITATPNTVGQFLVGILVEEWRNGSILSIVRRDFEYNVRVCSDVAEIDFEAPDLTCDGLTVTFNNTSNDNFGYKWYFDYPNESAAFTSTAVSPTFTYPSPGFYNVRLTSLTPENECEVEITKRIGVFNSNIETDLSIGNVTCTNGAAAITLTSNAVDQDPEYNIENILWTITTPSSTYTVSGEDAIAIIPCGVNVQISLQATSSNGCSASQSITFNTDIVNIDIDIAGDTLYICEGESVALLNSVIEGLRYSWSPLEGLSFTDLVNYSDPIASPLSTTLYTVTVTNSIISDTATVLVIVSPRPNYTITPSAVELCEGSSTQLAISSTENLTYEWLPSAGLVTTSPYSSSNPLINTRENASYVVNISNGLCTITDTVEVVVIPTEVDEVEGAIRYTVNYDTLSRQLDVSINETELRDQYDIVSVRWTVMSGGEMFSGDGSSISVVLSASTSAKISYYFTDSQGCEYEITRILPLANGGKDFIDIAGDTLYICEGESVALLNSVIEGLRYSWSPLEGLSFTDLVNYSDPIASPLSTTLYTVTVTNSIISDTATVLVIVSPRPNYTITPSAVELCEGSSTQLEISSTENLTYEWLPSAGLVTTSPYSSSNPLINTRENASYVVSISNGLCTITDTVEVVVIPTEVDEVEGAIRYTVNYDTLSRQLDVSINETELRDQYDIVSVRWTVMSGGEMFSGDGSSISVVLSASTSAKISYYFTDSQGCEYEITRILPLANGGKDFIDIAGDTLYICEGESVALLNSVIEGLRYSWSPLEGLSFTDLVNYSDPIASPLSTTLYTVTVTNSIISDTATVLVIVSPRPNYTITPSAVELCEGSSTQLAISSTENLTYEWLPSAGLVTTSPYSSSNPLINTRENASYVVNISNGLCTITDTVEVVVIPTEVDEVEGAIRYTVNYDTLSRQLDVSINETELRDQYDIVSIRWTVMSGGEMFSGDGSSISVVLSASTSAKISYYFTDSQGCEYEITRILPLANGGKDFIDIAGDTLYICEGESVALLNSVIEGLRYSWSPLEGLSFTDLVNYSDPIASPLSTTLYTVTVTNSIISDTATVLVIVSPRPNYTITPSAVELCEGSSTQLEISSTENLTYEWLPSAGLVTTSPYSSSNPLINTRENASYVVSISNGLCTITDTVEVVVIPTEVDEVEGAIKYTVNYDTLSRQLDVSINETELRDQYDIVSIRWTVMSGGEMFSGDGSSISVVLSASTSAKISYYFTDSQGCEYEITRILPLANGGKDFIDIAGDTLYICEGESVALLNSVIEGLRYSWSPLEGLSFTDLVNYSDPIASPLSTTLYTVTVTNSIISDTATVLVIVSPRPNYTITPSAVELCEGSSTQLEISSTENLTYEWLPSAGLVTTSPYSSSNPLINTRENASYVVSISNGLCTITDTVEVVVIPTEVDEVEGAIRYTVNYDTLSRQLDVSINETELRDQYDIVSIRWTVMSGGEMFSGDGSSISVVLSASTSAKISYYFTDSQGCEYEITRILPLANGGKDFIDIAGDTLYICEGESVALLNSVIEGLRYSWSPLEGLSFTDLVNYSDPIASPLSTTLYTVTVTNSIISDTATVLVIVSPRPNYTITPSAVELCEGSSTQLEISSTENLTYEWLPSAGLVTTSPYSSSNPLINTRENASYVVSISNGLCTITDTVEVVVIPTEVDEVEGAIRYTVNYDTLSRQLDISINETELRDQYDIVSIRWTVMSGGEMFSGDGSSISVVLSASTSAKISYYFTDSQGCEYEITRILPLANGGKDFIDIAGDTLYICEGESVALLNSVIEGLRYSWSPLEGLSFTDLVNYSDPIASPLSTTLYTVTVTNSIISDTATVLVIVSPRPNYMITPSAVELCEGSSTQLQISSAENLTYEWLPSAGLVTTSPYSSSNPLINTRENASYVVSISNGLCTITDTVEVVVIPTEVDEVEGAIRYTVNYDTLSRQLDVSINETELRDQYDIVSIRWTVMSGGEMFSGDGSSISVVLSASTSAKISYYFTDSQGCEYEITRILPLANGGKDFIDIAGDTLYICEGESVALLNSVIEGLRYSWSPLEGLSFTDLVNYSDPIASPLSTTLYTVTVTNSIISDTATVLVIVSPRPNYTITPSAVELCEGSSTQLEISSTENLTYEWLPSAGLVTTSPYSSSNPLINTRENASYVVSISNGLCTITDTVEVVVIPTEVDEVEGAIRYTVNYDTLSRQLDVSINETELRDQYDIVSIRWTVMAGEEMLSGDGANVLASLPYVASAKLTYFFTDSQGCEYEVTTIIELNDVGTPTVLFINQDTITVCLGDTTAIIANPNSLWTYNWTPEDNLIFTSESDKSNPLFVGSNSQLYVVSVSNGVITVSDSVFINVIDIKLDLSFNTEKGTSCQGVTTLTVNNANHSDATTYEWSFSENFQTIVANTQLASINVEGDSVRIYVRAQDPGFCGSNVAFIDVLNTDLDLQTQFEPLNICISDTTQVTIQSNVPNKNVSIEWLASDNIISSNLISNTISVKAMEGETQVSLDYIARDSAGCEFIGKVVVPVLGILNVNIIGDTLNCSPLVNLSVSSQENNATYEWSTSSDFAETIATGAEVGLDLPTGRSTIYVRGAHPDYCKSSIDSITILNNAPKFELNYPPLNLCVDNKTTIDLVNLDPNQTLNFIWSSSQNITSDPNVFPLNIEALTGENKIVLNYTVSNNLGCELSDSVVIDVLNELIVDIAVDTVSCDGTTGTFRAIVNATGADLEWSLDPAFGSILSTESSLTVSLPGGQPIYLRASTALCNSNIAQATLPSVPFSISTNAPDFICVGDVYQLIATDGDREFTIMWEASENITSALDSKEITIQGIEGQENITLNYSAVSIDGCVDEGIVIIPYGSVVMPDTAYTISCGTYALVFDAKNNINNGDILWDFGISGSTNDTSTLAAPTFDFGAPGDYTVTATSLMKTCSFDPVSFIVTVPEILKLTSDNVLDFTSCSGDTTITLIVNNNLGLPVNWFGPSDDLIFTGDSLTINSSDYTRLTAVSTDENGCTDFLIFTFGDYEFDLNVVFPGGGGAVCAGQEFTISIVDSTNSNLTYAWTPANVILVGQGTATVTASITQATPINVVVTNQDNGCTETLTITPEIKTISVEAVADPDNEIFLGESVSIIATSNDNILTYSWSNGANTSTQVVSPTENTTYTVTVTDDNGCTATDDVLINVIQPLCDETDVFLPTAFSPNGDGQNDVFFVRSNFIESMTLVIINRWGQEVFSSVNPRDGWNGTFRGTGKELESDVYAYKLRVICVDGQEYTKSGNVALVR